MEKAVLNQSLQAHRRGAQPKLLTRVLMSRPEYFAIPEAGNPFTRHETSVDVSLALRQWETLCAAFNRVGERLPLRVALNAHIRRLYRLEANGVDDI